MHSLITAAEGGVQENHLLLKSPPPFFLALFFVSSSPHYMLWLQMLWPLLGNRSVTRRHTQPLRSSGVILQSAAGHRLGISSRRQSLSAFYWSLYDRLLTSETALCTGIMTALSQFGCSDLVPAFAPIANACGYTNFA